MTRIFDAYASYYDLLYRDKDYRGEASYLQSLLTRHGIAGGRLLELGCGTGRHAEHLARLGYTVHGIDSSAAMVELARNRTTAELDSQLSFQAGDLRTARLDATFDAVVSVFHVASYQTTNQDLAAMFATAECHLKIGGMFIFDFWYGPGVLTDLPVVRVKRLQDSNVAVTRIAEPTLYPNQNLVEVRYTVFVTPLMGGDRLELEETHRMRYLFLPELELMLQTAGMEIVNAERWLSGELDMASWQAVITARKRPHAAT